MHDALSRRDLLVAGGTAAVGSGLFPLTSVAARRRRNPIAAGGHFSSGVAAGLPALNGALLWTRVDELGGDRALPRERARLRVEVARDADFRQVVHRAEVAASQLRDGTVHADVRSPRLKPDEEYHYRFLTRSSSSRVGRFRTLRPPDSREPVRIGYFSCQRYEHGFFTPHAGLAAEEDLDLVVSLGDYIYEEDATPKLPERRDPSGGADRNVQGLDQFRSRYRTYRSDERLQDMHARHAMVQIWDDCEVEGNWAGDGPSSGPTPVDRRSIPFAQKRANAFNAYFEWMPVPRVRGVDRYKVYRSVRLGREAELLLLDTRQHRDPQPCGDRDFTGGPCDPAEDEAPRKRLGDQQKAWLKDRLVASQATWKVLGNAQMMMQLDIVPGQPVAHDDWGGYAAERREVLEHVRANGVQDLTSIVGDVHVFFAGNLHTGGRVDSPRIGTEFVGASVSHDALTLPGLPADGSALVTERLPLANPHLVFADFRHRGYAVLEASREQLRVDFRAVSTVLEPTATTSTLASFAVAAGGGAVQRL